jgi:hypothetical protein
MQDYTAVHGVHAASAPQAYYPQQVLASPARAQANVPPVSPYQVDTSLASQHSMAGPMMAPVRQASVLM